MTTDLLDCKDNIDKAGRDKAADSQAKLIQDMLSKEPPEPVTLYAHSQGGLITQEGLAQAKTLINTNEKKQLELENMSPTDRGRTKAEIIQLAAARTRSKMNSVHVYSFGTAERDWPDVGAHYHQFTNTADPVPKVISAVQQNRGRTQEPTNLVERERFEQTSWTVIGAHNMDDVYIPQLEKYHPTPKQANGQCC